MVLGCGGTAVLFGQLLPERDAPQGEFSGTLDDGKAATLVGLRLPGRTVFAGRVYQDFGQRHGRRVGGSGPSELENFVRWIDRTEDHGSSVKVV